MTTHIDLGGCSQVVFKCQSSFFASRGLCLEACDWRLVIVSMCITAMISDLHLCIRHGRDEDNLPLGKNLMFLIERVDNLRLRVR